MQHQLLEGQKVEIWLSTCLWLIQKVFQSVYELFRIIPSTLELATSGLAILLRSPAPVEVLELTSRVNYAFEQ